ncbi:MAG: hypothetical protein HQM15_02235 [Deltaproteobacteria bacterium]|nr:hypothetical protein [Deltaproteobacteria bacterium]
MPEAQILMQCFVAQNALKDVVERFSRSLDNFHQAILSGKYPRLQKISYTFDRFHQSISTELENLKVHLGQSKFSDTSLSEYFNQILDQAHCVRESLAERFQDLHSEQSRLSFSKVVERVSQFRSTLAHFDAKSMFSQSAQTLGFESLESLGEQSKIQWARKMWHVLAGFGIIAIYLFSRGTFNQKMAVFGGFTLYSLFCDSMRFVFPRFNQRVLHDLKSMMRKKEATRLNSQTFYSVASFIVCCLFPMPIAVLSILYLAVGDTMASVVGVYFGRTPFVKNLSVEGSLAFFTSCFMLTFLYPILDPAFHGSVWILALCGGLAAASSEFFADKVDDNFVIPLFSSLFLFISAMLLG